MSREYRKELRDHYKEMLGRDDVSHKEGKRAEYLLGLLDKEDKAEEEAEKTAKELATRAKAPKKSNRWL